MKRKENMIHSQQKRKSMVTKPEITQMSKLEASNFKAATISMLRDEKETYSQ